MQRDLSNLTETSFDLAVIGGGIFGVCAAWDAAQRGLSVALIERADFGGATSAHSFRIVHGGIRYIQHGDIYRVRQASHERRALLRIAPHLVRPLPIVIPTYGHGMRGKAALRVGMGLYDLLTADGNRGIRDPARRIPRGRVIGRDEALSLFPGLDRQGLTGAAVFYDGQMYNPPRLVLAFLQRAACAGAVAANYVEATRLLRDGDRATGVAARDVLSGGEFEIHARVVLNAAGPYAERLLLQAANMRLSPAGTYSRDACFVVPRRLLDGEHALAVQARTRDPGAIISRGERHLFVAPWRDYTLIGVWHEVYTGDPDGFTVTDAELQRFIDEVNAGYPELQLSLDDVSICDAGLVPFGENPEGAVHLRYGHRSRLVDHARSHGVENLLTLIGVRFTTGRYEAQRAIDGVFKKLGRKAPASRTALTAVYGGEVSDWQNLVRDAVREYGEALGPDVVRSLLHNYGSEYKRVLLHADSDPGMSASLGNSTTIRAQVLHAVRHEMAETVGDIVFRRTDLATGEYPGRAALRECASILAAERSLPPGELERQIDDVAIRFPADVTRRVDQSGARAAGTTANATGVPRRTITRR